MGYRRSTLSMVLSLLESRLNDVYKMDTDDAFTCLCVLTEGNSPFSNSPNLASRLPRMKDAYSDNLHWSTLFELGVVATIVIINRSL